MLKEITDFSLKSFKNFSTPNDFFKSKNIIFGYNGRGKSSLSEGIIRSYQANSEEIDSFRFFNSKYVKEHLLLNDSDSIIKGVKVSFSENDKNITEEIENLESKIVDTTSSNDECKRKRELLREQIDSIHSNKKGKAKIKRKNSNCKIEEVITQYENDLDAALKINPSRNFIKDFYADSEELSSTESNIKNTPIPDLNIKKISQDDQQFLMQSLQKKYPISDDIPVSKVIEWLENGIYLHEDSDSTCKFCHNSFNLQHVKDKISEYRKNSRRKDIVRLEQIKDILITNRKMITEAQKIKNNLVIMGLTSEKIKELFNFKYSKILDSTVNIIDNKISNMQVSIMFDNCIASFEDEVDTLKTKISKIRTNKLNELSSSISNIETLAKGAICIAIEESDVPDALKEIQKLEYRIEEDEKKNKELQKQIKILEDSRSEYREFMEFLNEILSSLGIQIKLMLENENYYLKHTLEDAELSVDDISEGEKNLLALLYFYFELYEDKEQKKIRNTIKLIVIDDPISSLDEANKFYVLEIMKKILSESDVQIFILTHSWEDFYQMTYGKKSDNKYGLFEIYKNANNNFQSDIQICKNNVTPYKKLFLEIHQLQDKSLEQLDECDTYHAANSMRRIFEEFLKFKKSNLLPQNSNQHIIEEIYKKATGKELDAARKRKLGSLLTFINVLSHRPIKSEEIINNSKTLMAIIKDIDKVHYDEMKNTPKSKITF